MSKDKSKPTPRPANYSTKAGRHKARKQPAAVAVAENSATATKKGPKGPSLKGRIGVLLREIEEKKVEILDLRVKAEEAIAEFEHEFGLYKVLKERDHLVVNENQELVYFFLPHGGKSHPKMTFEKFEGERELAFCMHFEGIMKMPENLRGKELEKLVRNKTEIFKRNTISSWAKSNIFPKLAAWSNSKKELFELQKELKDLRNRQRFGNFS